MGLGSPAPGDLEAVADLDALDRLDAHQRLGQQGVELAVPVHVAAEPDRHAVGEHLDDAAERVAVLGRRLDLLDHRLLGRGVEAAHLGVVDALEVGRRRAARSDFDRHRAHLDHVATAPSTPMCASSALAQRAGRDPGRRLARRGPLEHVAGVVEAVLLHAGQVGVARAGAG